MISGMERLSTREQAFQMPTAEIINWSPVSVEKRSKWMDLRPGSFGAYYTQLKYYDEWDALWRVGDHSDIVVQFDESLVRVVFWRGTRYSPVWVMENGQWMADQSAENFDTINGCDEHMIDPRCMFSHVRIIENTKSRVVVHWRYIPVSVRNDLSQMDKRGENPTDPVIQIVNLKSENKPFLICEPENRMEVFGIDHRKDISSFPWWNHWPVAQLLSDGRYCQTADRASHFSLA
jgi:hypothetical protein